MRLHAGIITCITLGLASAAQAHPHIFVDAGLTLIRDAAGRVTAVDVTWRYDELYSLILLEDYGLDPDFDLSLTPAEIAQTLGFDLNWNGGFTGGLVLSQGDRALEVGTPEPISLTLLSSGQIETVHRRPVSGGEAGDVAARIFDAAFYVAFEMTLDMEAAGCAPVLVRPDLDAAYALLASAIADIGGSVDADDNFPAVGAAFADTVVFQCAG